MHACQSQSQNKHTNITRSPLNIMQEDIDVLTVVPSLFIIGTGFDSVRSGEKLVKKHLIDLIGT